LDFESLSALYSETIKVKPLPRFPAIVRDLSLVVDEQVRWSQIIKAVNENAPAELENVRFVGVYRGKSIPAGRKSVTLSLLFRDEDGTLTHDTVDGFQTEILKGLTESVGAELRTI
jgi:phenylalanyl-tRNA synthetase beta chain